MKNNVSLQIFLTNGTKREFNDVEMYRLGKVKLSIKYAAYSWSWRHINRSDIMHIVTSF
jgi:hypothetical protein